MEDHTLVAPFSLLWASSQAVAAPPPQAARGLSFCHVPPILGANDITTPLYPFSAKDVRTFLIR